MPKRSPPDKVEGRIKRVEDFLNHYSIKRIDKPTRTTLAIILHRAKRLFALGRIEEANRVIRPLYKITKGLTMVRYGPYEEEEKRLESELRKALNKLENEKFTRRDMHNLNLVYQEAKYRWLIKRGISTMEKISTLTPGARNLDKIREIRRKLETKEIDPEKAVSLLKELDPRYAKLADLEFALDEYSKSPTKETTEYLERRLSETRKETIEDLKDILRSRLEVARDDEKEKLKVIARKIERNEDLTLEEKEYLANLTGLVPEEKEKTFQILLKYFLKRDKNKYKF